MSEAASSKGYDLTKLIKEEFNFSLRMFFAPVTAIVREVRRQWAYLESTLNRGPREN